MEGDRKVSLRELVIQLDQFLVAGFIPVLGWTPQLPEPLLNVSRLIQGEVLVNGTPCAIQSASNPAIVKF